MRSSPQVQRIAALYAGPDRAYTTWRPLDRKEGLRPMRPQSNLRSIRLADVLTNLTDGFKSLRDVGYPIQHFDLNCELFLLAGLKGL